MDPVTTFREFRSLCETHTQPVPPITDEQKKLIELNVGFITNSLNCQRYFNLIKQNGSLEIICRAHKHGLTYPQGTTLIRAPDLERLTPIALSILKDRLIEEINPKFISVQNFEVYINVCNYKRIITLNKLGLSHYPESASYHVHFDPKTEIQKNIRVALLSYNPLRLNLIDLVVARVSHYAQDQHFRNEIQTGRYSKVYVEIKFNELDMQGANATDHKLSFISCFQNFLMGDISLILQEIRELNLFPMITPKCRYKENSSHDIWTTSFTGMETSMTPVRVRYRLYPPSKHAKIG